MGFDGMRVLALESRRANEIATLIRNQGGDPFVAPSMREAEIEGNTPAREFGERLAAGEFDMMVLLTGVGTRALAKAVGPGFVEGLRKITVVARGPKPMAALRELDVPVTVAVPEPNTWRELLEATAARSEKRIAVQEYGRSNDELLDALRARGAEVTPVRVYQWALPADTAPLRDAVKRAAAGEFDFAMFTTSIQIPHFARIAAEEGVESEAFEQLRKRAVIASIGPTCSEMLDEYGLATDIAPSHPKMGFLVKETADQAAELIRKKRG